MSFKALKNTLFCLISHCDHVSIETILFVLSIDTCASIKGTQLPIVSRGSRVEWLFTPQPSRLLQKVSENKQLPSLSMRRDAAVRPGFRGVRGVKRRKAVSLPLMVTAGRDRLLLF